MELTIISPLRTQLFKIAWIELNTPVGNFIIQPGHAPTILSLTPDQKITFCLANGKRESLFVPQGITEITRTSTTIYLNKE